MLTWYSLKGLYDQAIDLFLQMQTEGIKHNPFTFATVGGALADNGAVVKMNAGSYHWLSNLALS